MVEALTRSFVSRLLHDRTVSLRQGVEARGPDEEQDLLRLWDPP